MTLADDLDVVWTEAAGIFADAFHSDDYEIWRPTKVDDGRGGRTQTAAMVENGRCVLQVSMARSGGEQVTNDLALTITAYTAELPIASTVVTTDELRINGRVFNVRDVKRGGDWALFTLVELEEQP